MQLNDSNTAVLCEAQVCIMLMLFVVLCTHFMGWLCYGCVIFKTYSLISLCPMCRHIFQC